MTELDTILYCHTRPQDPTWDNFDPMCDDMSFKKPMRKTREKLQVMKSLWWDRKNVDFNEVEQEVKDIIKGKKTLKSFASTN